METLLTTAAIFSSNLEQSYSSYHLILPTVRIFVNVTILSPIVRWKHCYSYDVIILYDWWSKQNWAYFSVSKRRSCQKLSFQSALCLIFRKNIKHIRPKLFVFFFIFWLCLLELYLFPPIVWVRGITVPENSMKREIKLNDTYSLHIYFRDLLRLLVVLHRFNKIFRNFRSIQFFSTRIINHLGFLIWMFYTTNFSTHW